MPPVDADGRNRVGRRQFLAVGAMLGVGGLAGCVDTVRSVAGDAADAADDAAGDAPAVGHAGPDPRWEFEVTGWPGDPTLADGTLYLGESFGGSDERSVYAISADDGSLEWRTVVDSYTLGTVVDGDVVYAGGGSEGVIALSRDDGSRLWASSPSDASTMTAPAVVGDRLYAGSLGNGVYALAADDGSVVWRHDGYRAQFGRPTVADGVVYVGSNEGSVVHDDDEWGFVYALDADDGSVVWEREFDSPIPHPITVVDDRLYVSGMALSVDDGSTVWEGEGSGETKPLVVNGTVYLGSPADAVWAFDAADGSTEWRFDTEHDVYSRPALVEDTLFVGASNNMYALDPDDATVTWRFERDESFYANVVVDDDTVYAGCTDHTVYAVPRQDG